MTQARCRPMIRLVLFCRVIDELESLFLPLNVLLLLLSVIIVCKHATELAKSRYLEGRGRVLL